MKGHVVRRFQNCWHNCLPRVSGLQEQTKNSTARWPPGRQQDLLFLPQKLS